jgi:hypothetical protein
MAGSVVLTQPQSLYTYPRHALHWLVPPLTAIGPTLWLHLLVTGLGFAAMGARMGLSRGPRLVMGVAGLLSFKLLIAVYAGWTPVLPSFSLLPWFATAVAYCAARGSAASVLQLAAGTALVLLAGTLQPYYYLGLFVAAGLIVSAVRKIRHGGAHTVFRRTLTLAVASALGGLLAAHIWLPVGFDFPLLTRSGGNYEFFLGGHALRPAHLLTLLSPEALGTPIDDSYPGSQLWEDVMYVGIVPLLLAPLGAWSSRRAALGLGLVLALIFSSLLAFDGPALRAAYAAVPGYSLFRCPARILFVSALPLIALAGLGAAWLEARIALRSRRAASLFLLVALAAMTAEGLWRARRYVEVVPHAVLSPKLPILAELELDAGPYRLASFGRLPLNYGWTALHQLQVVSGYDPYAFAHYREFAALIEGRNRLLDSPRTHLEISRVERFDLLERLNVRYLIGRRPLTLPEGWRLKQSWPRHPGFFFRWGIVDQPLYLYERFPPPPRVFLAPHVRPTSGPAEARRTLLESDARELAVVEVGSEMDLVNSPSAGDFARVVRAGPGHLEFESRTDGPRFAVVSEVWHPGWGARIDGTATPLYRADTALLGWC